MNNKIEEKNFMDLNSDMIITIGTRIATDDKKVDQYIKNMVTQNDCEFIYMHPIDDVSLHNTYTQYIKYEAGSEEGVLALLTSFLLSDTKTQYDEYLEDLDIGYLSGETSIGEEEFEDLVENMKDKKNITMIIGDDIIEHKHLTNIKNILRLVSSYTNINVIVLDKNITLESSEKIELNDVEDIQTYNGTVIYTAKSDDDILKGSSSFAMAAKIKDGDTVNIACADEVFEKRFQIDPTIRGTIALYPILSTDTKHPLQDQYRFMQVKIQKV